MTRPGNEAVDLKLEAERHLPLRSAPFHILLSLAAGAGHGYGIKREVEERTGNRVRLAAGTLYEALQRLERRALIRETEAPEDVGDPKQTSRWRFFELTDLGRAVLAAELERLEGDVTTARRLLASVRSGG